MGFADLPSATREVKGTQKQPGGRRKVWICGHITDMRRSLLPVRGVYRKSTNVRALIKVGVVECCVEVLVLQCCSAVLRF